MTQEQEVQAVLDNCRIEDNIVYLPNEQLDRKLYTLVNKKLEGIGGKWNRSAKGHVFLNDPSELMGRILEGEKINLKKDYQFFETPPELADKLVELAFEVPYEIGRVLEPSAGQGAIIDAIHRYEPDILVHCFELMPHNRIVLEEKYGLHQICLYKQTDFLKSDKKECYSTIIANPPFTKNQDIEHLYKMYYSLEHGGRLVCIVSNHYENSVNRKEVAFREFLEVNEAEIHNIPMGSFKASGTLVGGKIIVINKK